MSTKYRIRLDEQQELWSHAVGLRVQTDPCAHSADER